MSWICALGMEKYSKNKKLFLILDLVFMLGVLGIFKYLGFFLTNVQMIFGIPETIPSIVLPIGISFYTFQLISYDIDVYKGQVKVQKDFWKLLLYSSLFHQCIAGPIVRYETVANEIDNRVITINDVYYGVRRFSIGLAKKAVLANSCASVADTLLPIGSENLAVVPTLGLWLGGLFYALHIYLDFSAYSDMAIGMGRMVGFHYLENFNYPYIAKSVQDFWRRWHISLSSFFRDYVYIPLGGNRGSKSSYIRNISVVWFLTGLWHGASWNYILWGLYYLGFLLLEKFYLNKKIPKGFNHVYTLFVVLIGWIIFRFENISELFQVLIGLVGFTKGGFYSMVVGTQFKANVFLLIASIVACTPFGKIIHNIFENISRNGNNIVFTLQNVIDTITVPLLLILSFLALIGNSYNPFIYFQF
ncbi:MAG: MBOAT family O-acyltransferase [Bacillota bacterium]|nr:MBOAT family O-acyltransferase [Bacillota bacterium]